METFGRFFKRYKFIYFVAFMGILVISAFTTRPGNSPSFKEATLPPDSLTKIDMEGTALLLKEFKLKQLADSLVSFALSLEGKPYRYGGESPKGFDCSGFVLHVFKQFNYELNRSSRGQVQQGTAIELEEVKKGDLLFFTGTNPQKKQVGHVGIVISDPFEEVKFVHSSSNGGVKVSVLDGYYQTRFMQAKRFIGME